MKIVAAVLLPIILLVGTASKSVHNVVQTLWSDVKEKDQDVAPQVKILMPKVGDSHTWGDQVRYKISVSDAKDGESQYGEIISRKCLLSIEYRPVADGNTEDIAAMLEVEPEPEGLSLITRSTCFGCHADKRRVAGPSFEEIAKRYKSSPNLANLAAHIIGGSSGSWGDQLMPAHPDLMEEEAKEIAEYVLSQGADPHRWVLSGLEGAFRIIAKPENDVAGVYILTASYTSNAGIRGTETIVLKIK